MSKHSKGRRIDPDPAWIGDQATAPSFRDVDVYVEADGDGWRVDVIARPANEVLGSDRYPDEDLASARATDFARVLEQHWSQFGVLVHRRFLRPKSDM